MTIEEARKDIIEAGINLGAGDYVSIEALKVAAYVLGIIEQLPVEQLEDLGISLGKKVYNIKAIDINELAEGIEEKMTYMCGCKNCIETVTQIIKDERKPFDSKCNECGLYETRCKEHFSLL